MALNITKSDVDRARIILRKALPYDKNDPILKLFDAPTEASREASTFARDWLEALGLDPYDDNDYGDIPE